MHIFGTFACMYFKRRKIIGSGLCCTVYCACVIHMYTQLLAVGDFGPFGLELRCCYC